LCVGRSSSSFFLLPVVPVFRRRPGCLVCRAELRLLNAVLVLCCQPFTSIRTVTSLVNVGFATCSGKIGIDWLGFNGMFCTASLYRACQQLESSLKVDIGKKKL